MKFFKFISLNLMIIITTNINAGSGISRPFNRASAKAIANRQMSLEDAIKLVRNIKFWEKGNFSPKEVQFHNGPCVRLLPLSGVIIINLASGQTSNSFSYEEKIKLIEASIYKEIYFSDGTMITRHFETGTLITRQATEHNSIEYLETMEREIYFLHNKIEERSSS